MKTGWLRDLAMLSPVLVFLVLTLAHLLSVPRSIIEFGIPVFVVTGVTVWAIAVMQVFTLDLPRREKLLWLAVSVFGSLLGAYLFYFARFRRLPNESVEPKA